MESIEFPPQWRRRPESVGGERVVSFDIGPPPPDDVVGGYMPRYTSTTNICTIHMYHPIQYYYAVLYILTRVVPTWANTFTQDKFGIVINYMSQMSKQKDIQDKEGSRFILGLGAREEGGVCEWSGLGKGGPGGGAIWVEDR